MRNDDLNRTTVTGPGRERGAKWRVLAPAHQVWTLLYEPPVGGPHMTKRSFISLVVLREILKAQRWSMQPAAIRARYAPTTVKDAYVHTRHPQPLGARRTSTRIAASASGPSNPAQ